MNIIDLTHEMNENMSLFPGANLYALQQTATIEEKAYIEHRILLTTHLGTHVDSPNHIFEDGKRLTELDIKQFVGQGIVIDATKIGNLINETLLKEYKGIEEAEFILIYTGHCHNYGKPAYYEDFPLLDASAMEYIVCLSKKNLKGIGIDTLSIDPIDPAGIDRHKILLSEELIIIENLANLHKLIDKKFLFEALPLKMEKIEGSPVRAIAIISE